MLSDEELTRLRGEAEPSYLPLGVSRRDVRALLDTIDELKAQVKPTPVPVHQGDEMLTEARIREIAEATRRELNAMSEWALDGRREDCIARHITAALEEASRVTSPSRGQKPPPVSPVREAEIRALEAAATPGPWMTDQVMSDGEHDVCLGYEIPGAGHPIVLATVFTDAPAPITTEDATRNAAFIADARSAVPQLLAIIDHERARADECERWSAILFNERECDKGLMEAERAVQDARLVALLAEAKALAAKGWDDPYNSNPAEIVLDWLDAAWKATRKPAELPPHEVTLADNRRMREALVEMLGKIGDGKTMTVELYRIVRAALGEDA